jgi:DNA polymerase-3 subunit delta
MKIDNAQVAGFLRDPGAARVVLLYGEDAGLIRERAEGLVSLVAGSRDDPFRVVELMREEAERLPDEAASLSLSGGRRVVRLRETPDTAGMVTLVQTILRGNGTALVVLEGGGLPARSKLRTLLDAAPDGAAIACYPEDGRAKEETIRQTLRAAGVTVDPDALRWLSDQLGADRASTRAELEKLALFVGPAGRVDLDSAMACVGDLAGLSLDDALYAAITGDVATTDRALELAMSEGAAPVQVLRAALALLQRLHRCRLQMDQGGMGASEVVRTLRPPLFFRRVPPFSRALGLWPAATLIAAMAALAEAERGCKRTGYPDLALCRNMILTLGRRAASARLAASRR